MLQITVSVNAPEQDQWLRKLTDMRPCHGKTSQDQVNVRSLYLWVNCTLKVEPTKQMHIFTHSVAKQQLTAWNLVLLVQQTCAVYKVVFFKLLKKTFVQSVRNWIETVWRCSLKASDKMSCYLFIFKFKRKVKVAIKKKFFACRAVPISPKLPLRSVKGHRGRLRLPFSFQNLLLPVWKAALCSKTQCITVGFLQKGFYCESIIVSFFIHSRTTR